MISGTGQGTGANGPAVICEASGEIPQNGGTNNGFTQAPINTRYGWHYRAAVVDASGNFSFQDGGNIGGSGNSDLVLQYGQTYTVQGWTIKASPDGTRFTNGATGHGMFVSIDNTYPF
jgi:hypothetical protein